jgi:heme/copper-type cytochrome/quinol oxidase subunit 3
LLTDKNKLGMILFISSETIFFALLILAYLYFQGVVAGGDGPTAASSLDPLATGLFSLFLFASSFTIWRADRNLARQNRTGLLIWLLATIGLGLIFLAGQGLEWRQLIAEGTTVSRNLFGTTFFTLTGFHGFHVLVGLVALAIVAGLAWVGDFKGPKSSAVESISLYWHFVDVVWVVIFSVVYLRILL